MSQYIKNTQAEVSVDNVVPLVAAHTGYVKNARVVGVDGRQVSLLLSDADATRVVEGRVAFSCMVALKVNDQVICVQNETGMHVVLAIVERPDICGQMQDMTLDFPGNVKLRSQSGQVDIEAQKHVAVVAGGSIACTSKKAIHQSDEAVICYQQLHASGQTLNSQFQRIHVLCQTIHTFAKTAIQKFNQYVRRSTMVDKVSAAQMDRQADGMYSIKSNMTMMNSKKDTRIDGERIHMG